MFNQISFKTAQLNFQLGSFGVYEWITRYARCICVVYR